MKWFEPRRKNAYVASLLCQYCMHKDGLDGKKFDHRGVSCKGAHNF